MALPVERFFVLLEIVHERRKEEAENDLTQAAFIAWQIAQHQYAAMFKHVGFSVDKKNASKFDKAQREHWEKFPGFEKYLRDFGILKDD